LRRQTTRASSVAFIVKCRQRASKVPLPLAVDLTRRPDLADLHVNPHPAEVYDELSSHDHDHEE
jgi:hypothetical protein